MAHEDPTIAYIVQRRIAKAYNAQVEKAVRAIKGAAWKYVHAEPVESLTRKQYVVVDQSTCPDVKMPMEPGLWAGVVERMSHLDASLKLKMDMFLDCNCGFNDECKCKPEKPVIIVSWELT